MSGLSPEQDQFIERVSEEISGMVLMLSEETRNRVDFLTMLQSELLRHALMIAEVITNGDAVAARDRLHRALSVWADLR